MNCFWCNCHLTEETVTKDHFLARPFRAQCKNYIKIYPKTCDCCEPCNNARSRITSFYGLIGNFYKYKSQSLPRQDRLVKLYAVIEREIDFFRLQIELKLKPRHPFRQLMLYELDVIDYFVKEQYGNKSFTVEQLQHIRPQANIVEQLQHIRPQANIVEQLQQNAASIA